MTDACTLPVLRNLIGIVVLASAPLLAGCSADTGGESPMTTLEPIGTVTCGGLYRNQTAPKTGSIASYACAPNLTFSGGEWVQQFTATTTGDVLVSAERFDDYPFIAILKDNGAGLDPSACLAANYYSARASATAGQRYYVVIDHPSTTAAMSLDVEVQCSPSATETDCNNGFDDDGDQLIDCADPDCAAAVNCQVPFCTPDGAINCGDLMVTGSTSGFASTDVVNQYSCASDRAPNSSEHAYTFRPTSSGWVNFTLSDFGQYPMLFVIEDDGSGCNPNRCVAFNYYSVPFYATAGKTYYLVVDGWGGNSYMYHASLICDPPATETNCDDGIDNDGDALIDCADPDCATAAICAPGVCKAAFNLSCASKLVAGDTGAPGSTNAVPSYACSPSTDTTGPEFTYQLGPMAASGAVLVTASNYSTYPLITVLQDKGKGCNPAACVAEQYYSTRFTAQKGQTYYVTVEGDPSQPSMTYDLSVVCSPPSTEKGLCNDGIDNDGDFLIDCADPDCAATCQTKCTATGTLTGTTRLLHGDTSQGTSAIGNYGCYPNVSLPGNEVVYKYVAGITGQVLFTLSNITDYATLAVLQDTGSGCDANQCVAFQYYSVVANVKAGKTYYVAVDGPNAGTLSYDISAIENPPFNETGACSDGIDNDGDFLIDCADPDCNCQ